VNGSDWLLLVTLIVLHLQAARKTSRLIFDNGWFRRFAHDDELLVGHHDDTWELWEPDANMHEALQQSQPAP